MKRATLIRSLLVASSALAMTMCHASPETEAIDELPVFDPRIAASASWTANVELNNPACIRVRIQPRTICYNALGSPIEPGIKITLRQTPPGGSLISNTYRLYSTIDLLSIYNVSPGADVELQFAFSSGAAAQACAPGLALSSVPAGIVGQPTSIITFEPSAAWGGTGVPPLPFTDCHSTLYVTM